MSLFGNDYFIRNPIDEIKRKREIMEGKAELGEDFGFPLHIGDIIEGRVENDIFKGKVMKIEGLHAWIKRNDGKTNTYGKEYGWWAISRYTNGEWCSHSFYLGPEPNFYPIKIIRCEHKSKKKKINPLERIANALEIGKLA